MKRKIYVLKTLKDLAVFTAEAGEMMPEEVRPIAEQVRMQLGLDSQMQAVLLSAFVDMCDEGWIYPKDIANYFGVEQTKVLTVLGELDYFVNREIIYKFEKEGSQIAFRVAPGVMNALRKGHLPKTKNPDTFVWWQF